MAYAQEASPADYEVSPRCLLLGPLLRVDAWHGPAPVSIEENWAGDRRMPCGQQPAPALDEKRTSSAPHAT